MLCDKEASMSNLQRLIESALKKEDGTVADLGAVPTGHKRPKDDENIVNVNEDTIASFVDKDGNTITYNADSDDEGLYIRRPSGIKLRIRDNDLVVQTPGEDERTINLTELKNWIKAVQYLIDNHESAVK